MSCLQWHRDRSVGLTVWLCGLLGLTSCAQVPATAECRSESAVITPSTALLRSADPWQNVAIAGMGFVTGIVIHPNEPDLIYVRTDVGGIYRWQTDTAAWVQLLDGERDRYSIESVALDPSDPNIIYAATGAYTRNGDGEIIKSVDRGTTWTATNLSTPKGERVRMGGNEAWRWTGERLAVDPNNAQIVYFGSRLDGLYVSTNGAETWQSVTSFPTAGTPPGGITFVKVDPDLSTSDRLLTAPSQTIYVGVMGDGVYRSEDGGAQWTLMTGGPDVSQNPQQATIAADGTLYVTFFTTAADPQGTVWKYQQGQWIEITPEPGKNYTAIAGDVTDPNTVMVATYPFSPEGLYRSVNGGQSWQSVTLQVEAVNWWPDWHLYTLMGGLAINPQQPQQVWLTTGFGVMRTADITPNPSRWCAEMKNLEELVVFVLKSPPMPGGAYLFSGVADMDGFRHDSLTEYPTQTYDDSRFGDTTGIDFAEADPNIVVRVGSSPGEGGREDSEFRAAASMDNGRTWIPFAEPPAQAVNGKVAVAATLQPNGHPIMVWAPQGDIYPHRSLDGGHTWLPVQGAPNRTTLQLWFASQAIASDRVNGNLFYLYKYGESTGGHFYRSTDGGATWSPTIKNLPDSYHHAVKAAPDREGEVWLRVGDAALLRSSDGGLTFTPLAQIQQAHEFTFGQAAPGEVHPTVFVYGVVNGVEGLFRSDNAVSLPGTAAAATWIKISSDRQRLSNITYLEGDRMRYGHIYVGTSGRGILHGQPQ